MANSIGNQEGEARPGGAGAQEHPSIAERTAAGATALTNQQLRKARERVDEQLASQRAHVTGRVRTLGRALRGASQTLEDDDLVAQCLHFASDKLENVAEYVSELDPTVAAEDLRSVARERPAWFFGGAFVLGLALGRFARSTAEGMSAQTSAGRAPRTRAPRGTGASAPRSPGAAPRSASNQNGIQTRSGALRP